MEGHQNRDLIILSKYAESDVDSFEKEVRSINHVLYYVEGTANFCKAHEVIDINRYRIIDRDYLVRRIISDPLKPFVFLFNKN